MTEQEKKFLGSLQDKIDRYNIHSYKDGQKLTLRSVLPYAQNKFVMTHYNDGTPDEVVDVGIEMFLYKCSPLLFIEKYGKFELPGMGELSCKDLYYFQKEILKDFTNWKKVVLTKTRQCLTKENFVRTMRGNISIKDVKIGDVVETIKDGKKIWTRVLDFIPQGKRKICTVETEGNIVISTPDHKYLTKTGWKEAQKLTKNDWLLCNEDGSVEWQRFQKITYFAKEEEVYDITTETHDFLANGVVVHNCGISTLTSLIFWWKACMFSSEWLVIISKDGKSAQDFLEKIKLNINNIPQWLGLKTTKNNVKGVAFSNKTKIDTFARSKSAGRGTSPTMVVLDEAAFYLTNSIIEGIVSSVMPSLSRTGGQLFVVSTPNGSAEGSEGYWYYKQVMELMDKGGQDKLSRLYDIAWWEVLDYPGITPYKGFNEIVKKYIAQDYFNHPEIKKKANDFFMPIAKDHWKENDWLSYQMSTAGKVKYLQEILQNFVVMGNTVFSDEILSRVQKRAEVPIETDVLNHRPMEGLWIWNHPQPDHKYIVAVDVCKGSSDDSSCIQVLDMHTYEQVAEYSNKCTTIDLAHYVYSIGEYYNWAFTIVESNSIGEATFMELYYNLNYPNLFRQKKVKQGTEVMTGWITSVKTRELITNSFIDFYYDDNMWQHYFPKSERLLSQMKYWVWKGGRPDHSGNAHDDNILAMAIALYNVAEGIKKIKDPNEAVFYDEDGNGITIKEKGKHDMVERYFNSREDRGKTLDENKYRKFEEDMYRKAGFDPFDETTPDNYRWLLS